jgi:hypothetical protein
MCFSSHVKDIETPVPVAPDKAPSIGKEDTSIVDKKKRLGKKQLEVPLSLGGTNSGTGLGIPKL